MQLSNNKTAHPLAFMRDEKLYELCRKYGACAKLWRQKFIGLLPEVNRRRLYEEKGFSSIFEFAAKLCGLSVDQVRLALNLERRLEDKPMLKGMLENGEASINKLSRVVSIATPENEEELAAKIKVLPKSALDTWVRDVKAIAAGREIHDADGFQKPLFEGEGLPGQTDLAENRQAVRRQNSQSALRQTLPHALAQTIQFQIADDITADLNELHAKGIDVNELLREMLKRRRKEIATEKAEISENIGPAKSRYIPVTIRKILKQEYGEKCSIGACQKPSEDIHHTQRFSLSQNHDPHFLAPLCRDHHVIAHSIDLAYNRARRFDA